MSRFNPNKYYMISIDTTTGIHLGMTKKFKISKDKTFAVDEREEILKQALGNGLISEVKGIVFTMYEVKRYKLGNCLVEVKD